MKLKRANDRYLGGVCGGVAEYLGIRPIIVRIVWAVVSFIALIIPGLLIYIIFWVIMEPPDE